MRKLSESVWMDIHKHSTGDIDRKENSINILNLEGFCEYLITHYKYLDGGPNNIDIHNYGEGPLLVIMFCQDEHGVLRCLYYDGNTIYTQLDVFQTIGCMDELEQKYNTHVESNGHNVDNVSISPKDNSEITNTFFLEVLDFILDKVDVPLEPLIAKI